MTDLSIDFVHSDQFPPAAVGAACVYAAPPCRFPVMVANVEKGHWTYDYEYDEWDFNAVSKNVSYSLDGLEWMPSLDFPATMFPAYQFSYGNGLFMAACGQAVRSYDGIRWELCPGYAQLSVTGLYNGVDNVIFCQDQHFMHEISSGGGGIDRYRLLATRAGAKDGVFAHSGTITAMFTLKSMAFCEKTGWMACVSDQNVIKRS